MRGRLAVRSVLVMAVLLTAFFHAYSAARDIPKGRDLRPASPRSVKSPEASDLPATMQGTYVIVSYDFEPMNWQGWGHLDNTAPKGAFWHVEDYLEPELAGFPGPLEGTKSMWCGAMPGDDIYMCSWQTAPGYGNNWKQDLGYWGGHWKRCSPMTVSYKLSIDIEEEEDFLILEYKMLDWNWAEAARFTGTLDTIVSNTIEGAHNTKLRFRFVSDAAGSDEDGLYPSYGAAHIDSITVDEFSGTIHFEDFETYEDGSTYTARWSCDEYGEQYGLYAMLANNLLSKDPCGFNEATQIVFWNGSPFPSSEYPGLYNTPFCYGPGGTEEPCQDELVVSPPIDITLYSSNGDENQDVEIPPVFLGNLGGARLMFTVYRDLPLENLVFYKWHVRGIENGCPGKWLDRGLLYCGDEKEYIYSIEEIGDLLDTDTIQVALGVVDMCAEWFDLYGNCAEHTPAPWFDDVMITRYQTIGPQWMIDDINLFQDNFPELPDIDSYVRADMALDINPPEVTTIRPGDSIAVTCTSPVGGGIAEDTGGPRVYMHVRCTFVGPDPPKPDIAGPSIEGDLGEYVSDDGTWTVLQGDTAWTGAGTYAEDRYVFDLNDSLFTWGYMIEYYFKAYDNLSLSTTSPPGAETAGIYPYPKGSYHYEFTCLPTMSSYMLFVDDYHGIGSKDGMVHSYFDASFDAVMWPASFPDRYDVNGPTSLGSNGPGGRAKNSHLDQAYDFIIWDSGDLSDVTISDGTESDKSNDCTMLTEWLEYTSGDRTLWILGDNIASDLSSLATPAALNLLQTWCGVTLVDGSYYELTGGYDGGGTTTPEVRGLPGGDPFGENDSLCVFGGCPSVNDFDVLEATGPGVHMLEYPDYGGSDYYAAIGTDHHLSGIKQTMWFGFSFMSIRDCELPEAPYPEVLHMIRNKLLHDMIYWYCKDLGCAQYDISDAGETPAVTSLEPNYPNPFNPVTTIRFALREKGRIKLKIYDVAGRLIRTLVDEEREAGWYTERWDGTNESGSNLASGVYFMKMESGTFSSTRKLVLLK